MIKKALVQIVADASTLMERMRDENFVPMQTAAQQKQIDKRMERWQYLVADGSKEQFDKYLEWRNWDMHKVRSVLGKVELKDTLLMPNWANILEEILQCEPLESPFPIDSENPVPFEDVLLPIVGVARRRLKGYANLSEGTYLKLEQTLLNQLSRLCAQVLSKEFSAIRPAGYEFLSCLVEESGQSNQLYLQFVQELQQKEKWVRLFKKYPVMGRLVSIAVEFWVESTAEFISRLGRDLPDIQKTFGQGDVPLGCAVDIQTSLSDPHHRGRSVMIVTFTSGLKVVYKPRDLGISEAYNEFLKWCNACGQFKTVQVLNRSGYGWEEYIEHLPCNDEETAKRFYERSGKLLCVLYVLQARDCHYENLLAHGEYPIIVDTECLMSPIPKENKDDFFVRSVFFIGLLPQWRFKGEDNLVAFDISGFGMGEPKEEGKESQWKYVNTDSMVEMMVAKTRQYKNAPKIDNHAANAGDYVGELTSGFTQMYHWFLQRRDHLLAETSPLKLFQNKKVRYVCRNTSLYGGIQYNSRLWDCLRNGVDRSIELDQLGYAMLQTKEKPPLWSFLDTELHSMEQMDIPYLSMLSSEISNSIVKQSGYDEAFDLVKNLSLEDLKQQLLFINGSFINQKALAHAPQQQENPVVSKKAIKLHSAPDFLFHAKEIAYEIERHVQKDSDGNAKWIAPIIVRKSDRFRMQVVGDILYDGSCGIALFLSALDYVSQTSEFRSLALSAIQPLRQILKGESEARLAFAKTIGIGGFTGLGSIVYGLAKVGQFLNDESLIQEAQIAAELITPEFIKDDKDFDIIAGSAGTILALLSLYSVNKNPLLLEKALLCGKHLLSRRGTKSKPFIGFAHGAAGTSFALLKLYQQTGESCFLARAKREIAHENSLLKQAENVPLKSSWCNGYTGIALGRIGASSLLHNAAIEKIIASGLHIAEQSLSTEHIDHICCGNFGVINLLWTAAELSERTHLREKALQAASELLIQRKQEGTYRFMSGDSNPALFKPGLMQGLAGIGYELLRYSQRKPLPNVLLLQ